MIKVYIAAPSEEQTVALKLVSELKKYDIYTTSRWIWEDLNVDLEEWSVKDLQDVFDADVLVAYNPIQYANTGTGGRHVELGYALALEKPCIVYGARTNVFHYHPKVQLVEHSIDNLVRAIKAHV